MTWLLAKETILIPLALRASINAIGASNMNGLEPLEWAGAEGVSKLTNPKSAFLKTSLTSAKHRGTGAIVEHLAVFYDPIREPGPVTITSDYASSVVRRFFDLRSPVADYISVPREYVILQRINLGLFAVLGELSATADWRAISEEIWPFVHGPASTPMGEAEAGWQARRQAAAA